MDKTDTSFSDSRKTDWKGLTTLLLILLGGLGLNLTPCVLPMIPINLAILGAGSQTGSRGRGWALGSVYGAGMALAYGVLGGVVVFTGSKFGALNSSTGFNAAIALVFVVLALGMFGVFNIDLSRFQTGAVGNSGSGKGSLILAFTMGAVSALLAGACVAPVVISVLLQATTFYGEGNRLALALPMVLGLGMALPWPFAGAGLSFLPKPGRWMNWVKQGFGVIILLFAAYYGHLAWSLQQSTVTLSAGESSGIQLEKKLLQALVQAKNRPVFVDFSASWCKNCTAMEETTFKSQAVQDALSRFVVVNLPAEHPNESPAKQILDGFGVVGLPSYVILKEDPGSRLR